MERTDSNSNGARPGNSASTVHSSNKETPAQMAGGALHLVACDSVCSPLSYGLCQDLKWLVGVSQLPHSLPVYHFVECNYRS